ncbi:hypothetical protein MJM59_30645 [Salmonella enterica subsp. enterica serovar Montevideo]|nr:hypothetical protein [Salmonella enterica subsp. enterica serovar Montevideo]
MSQEYDLFLTDNPSNLTASGLLLSDDESGVRKIDNVLRLRSRRNSVYLYRR